MSTQGETKIDIVHATADTQTETVAQQLESANINGKNDKDTDNSGKLDHINPDGNIGNDHDIDNNNDSVNSSTPPPQSQFEQSQNEQLQQHLQQPTQTAFSLSEDEMSTVINLEQVLTTSSMFKDLDREDPWGQIVRSALLREVCVRFCLFHSFNLSKAEAHLRRVVEWRREWKPWNEKLENFGASSRHGLAVHFFPFYGVNRECIVYIASRYYLRGLVDKDEHDRGVIACLEHGLHVMNAKDIVVVLDYQNVGLKNIDLSARARELKTLKDYYPDGVSKLILVNHPKWLKGVWNIIARWLDGRTLERVKFVEGAEELGQELARSFRKEDLPKWFGGDKHMQSFQLLTGETMSDDHFEQLMSVSMSGSQ